MITVRIDGLREVEAALRELPKSTEAAVLRRVLKKRGQEGYAKFKGKLRLASDDQFGDHTTKIAPPFPLWVDTFRPEIERRRDAHVEPEGSATSAIGQLAIEEVGEGRLERQAEALGLHPGRSLRQHLLRRPLALAGERGPGEEKREREADR